MRRPRVQSTVLRGGRTNERSDKMYGLRDFEGLSEEDRTYARATEIVRDSTTMSEEKLNKLAQVIDIMQEKQVALKGDVAAHEHTLQATEVKMEVALEAAMRAVYASAEARAIAVLATRQTTKMCVLLCGHGMPAAEDGADAVNVGSTAV